MNRPSIIDEISRSNLGRIPARVLLKYRRMSKDVFSFFRGTDSLFAAEWEAGLCPPDPGPVLLQCGDLHLENFGAYITQDGEFVFDINDFDETSLAPAAFDLTRCVTSILLAADTWKLPTVEANRIALAFLELYRRGVVQMANPEVSREFNTGGKNNPITRMLGKTAAGTREQLLAQQTRVKKGGRPVIRGRDGLRPRLEHAEKTEVLESLKSFAKAQPQPEAYEVLSLRGRIAGIGSLGVRRYLALTHGDGPPTGYWLLDLKEILPSAVADFLSSSHTGIWTCEQERILQAHRVLLPKPPALLGTLKIGDRAYRIRAMVPAENRARIGSLQRKLPKLSRAVILAGKIAGWSHARGARFLNEEQYHQLRTWVKGAGLESVMAMAIRHAHRTHKNYQQFMNAFEAEDPRLRLQGDSSWSSHA